jgi:hypothetical protein
MSQMEVETIGNDEEHTVEFRSFAQFFKIGFYY